MKKVPLEYVPTLMVHGGAGVLKNIHRANLLFGVKRALMAGYEKFTTTGSVMETVLESVTTLELMPEFNAGIGSSLTCDGTVEMDAAVMSGTDLNCGCVSCVRGLLNPVLLAHRVLNCRHNFLCGEGAMGFAAHEGFSLVPDEKLMTKRAVRDLEAYYRSVDARLAIPVDLSWPEFQCDVSDSVGAIAMDAEGKFAVASSSGGTTGKISGRIGSAPIIGSGTYANNKVGSISVTGDGEAIIRFNVGTKILALLELTNMTPTQAINHVLVNMRKTLNLEAGAICIDKDGRVGVGFSTKRMIWAYLIGDNELHCGIDLGEDIKETNLKFWVPPLKCK